MGPIGSVVYKRVAESWNLPCRDCHAMLIPQIPNETSSIGLRQQTALQTTPEDCTAATRRGPRVAAVGHTAPLEWRMYFSTAQQVRGNAILSCDLGQTLLTVRGYRRHQTLNWAWYSRYLPIGTSSLNSIPRSLTPGYVQYLGFTTTSECATRRKQSCFSSDRSHARTRQPIRRSFGSSGLDHGHGPLAARPAAARQRRHCGARPTSADETTGETRDDGRTVRDTEGPRESSTPDA